MLSSVPEYSKLLTWFSFHSCLPLFQVTSGELNSIIQNIMTWVVATVTSILYPAITKYEERLKNNAYPVSDDSILSSDSSSFCSTCSEEFTYGSYTSATTKTLQGEPCSLAVDISVRRQPHLQNHHLPMWKEQLWEKHITLKDNL